MTHGDSNSETHSQTAGADPSSERPVRLLAGKGPLTDTVRERLVRERIPFDEFDYSNVRCYTLPMIVDDPDGLGGERGAVFEGYGRIMTEFLRGRSQSDR